MKPIVGTVSVKEQHPDTVAPVAPPHTYLGVALSLMQDINVLSSASTSPCLGLPFLCAHTLECILKAYLSKNGSDASLKEQKIRHNLEGLWDLAVSRGLGVPKTRPDWVNRLSSLHNAPYHLRYSTGVHGVVSPGAEPMVSELEDVIKTVRKELS